MLCFANGLEAGDLSQFRPGGLLRFWCRIQLFGPRSFGRNDRPIVRRFGDSVPFTIPGLVTGLARFCADFLLPYFPASHLFWGPGDLSTL